MQQHLFTRLLRTRARADGCARESDGYNPDNFLMSDISTVGEKGKQTEQCDFRGAHLRKTSLCQQNTGYRAGRTSFLYPALIIHLSL